MSICPKYFRCIVESNTYNGTVTFTVSVVGNQTTNP